jgi:hypothetical protein
MERLRVRAAFLSAGIPKAFGTDAGQKLSDNHLTPNALYPLLWHVYYSNHFFFNCLFYSKWYFQRYTNIPFLIEIIQGFQG